MSNLFDDYGESDDMSGTSANSDLNKNEKQNDELLYFREKWQNELSLRTQEEKGTHSKQSFHTRTEQEPNDAETKARQLFFKGIELEKSGKIYEALQYYRRAIQIEPDIEMKLYNKTKPKYTEEVSEPPHNERLDEDDGRSSEESDEDNEEELLPRIQRKHQGRTSLCLPKFDRGTIHIGQLPVEILLYILRWVVSEELDLRSLEAFSTVCRGFYLCGRDPEIWRLACLRIWKFNCGSSPGEYKSWRSMYIERPRVLFDGCYISRTSYIRNGENAFQDQFYRPWYLVAYYRLLRFFPDGTVLMLTSTEEPAQCISSMKAKSARYPVMSGYYRLKGDSVSLVVHRQDTKMVSQGLKKAQKEISTQTHHMEFLIKPRRRKHTQLVWDRHSVFVKSKNGDESTCNFELMDNRYPPLIFSRVKSFSAVSESPLV
ncbi:unnamed protein product [Phaedon cochleariae]|uniref:F-box only protein 9 n=1 Tax=Phaedon cochleariae TaxID=80249 RepID=A0A9N9SMP0_PHACE|nr:unnamed protein product [Phaedon cochleariae]